MSVAIDSVGNSADNSSFSPLQLFECTLANAGMLVDSMAPLDLVLALRCLASLHGRIVDVMEPSVSTACRLASAYKASCSQTSHEPTNLNSLNSKQQSVKIEPKVESKSSMNISSCPTMQEDANDNDSEQSDDCLIVEEIGQQTADSVATSVEPQQATSNARATADAEAALKDCYQKIKGAGLHPFDFSKPFEHSINRLVADRIISTAMSQTTGFADFSKDDLLSMLRLSIFNVFGPLRLKNKKSYTRTRLKQQKLARRYKAFEDLLPSLQPDELEQYKVVLTREFTSSDEEEEEPEETAEVGEGPSNEASNSRTATRVHARRHYWESERVRELKSRLDDLFLRRFATKRQRKELTRRRRQLAEDSAAAGQATPAKRSSSRMPPSGAPDWALAPLFRSRAGGD